MKAVQSKGGIIGEDMFKALLKVSSSGSLIEAFRKKLVAGKFDEIQYYLTTYVDCLNRHGHKFSYETFGEPLYRAIDPVENFKLGDYELFSIKQWPLF